MFDAYSPTNPARSVRNIWSTHFDKYGFQVTVRGGRNGYVEADADDGTWEWEPDPFVAVGFRLDKDADREWVLTNMVTVVRRILFTGPEDAAFVFNGEVLLCTRLKTDLANTTAPPGGPTTRPQTS
ncbi:hypothetical protein Ari01nite_33550 [Paractinoplanes rishiriensis]|uniref:Uncharacterized protein n=1 Tax=Paractinoplanes rishiriensis TaxID=1050105 RepID=A0A919JYL8_9ACTN|nr:hypothetical protein Ari01nite_33550 [Actinoplanes rishiriensis]